MAACPCPERDGISVEVHGPMADSHDAGSRNQDRQRFVRYLGAGTYSRFGSRRSDPEPEQAGLWRKRLVVLAAVLLAIGLAGVWLEWMQSG